MGAGTQVTDCGTCEGIGTVPNPDHAVWRRERDVFTGTVSNVHDVVGIWASQGSHLSTHTFRNDMTVIVERWEFQPGVNQMMQMVHQPSTWRVSGNRVIVRLPDNREYDWVYNPATDVLSREIVMGIGETLVRVTGYAPGVPGGRDTPTFGGQGAGAGSQITVTPACRSCNGIRSIFCNPCSGLGYTRPGATRVICMRCNGVGRTPCTAC